MTYCRYSLQNYSFFLVFYFVACFPNPKADDCRGCSGKVHTRDELLLSQNRLLIEKSSACQTTTTYPMVIIVKSGSYQRRAFTRKTWAFDVIQILNIPIFYAVGSSTNATRETEIRYEDSIYNDILQFDFHESYFNLTIKTTSVLVWFDRMCSKKSPYLLYVDDDVLINVEALVTYINHLKTTTRIEGWLEKSGRIQRCGIGGISKKEYDIDIVPDYLWGAAVLYPSAIINKYLLKTIFNTKQPIFFRDDVFINGFMANESGVERRLMSGVVLYDNTEDWLQNQMIVIDFPDEDKRQRAWRCFRERKSCNKDYIRLHLKLFAWASMIVVALSSIISCVRKSELVEILLDQISSFVLFSPFGSNRMRTSFRRAVVDMNRRHRFCYCALLNFSSKIRFILISIALCIFYFYYGE